VTEVYTQRTPFEEFPRFIGRNRTGLAAGWDASALAGGTSL